MRLVDNGMTYRFWPLTRFTYPESFLSVSMARIPTCKYPYRPFFFLSGSVTFFTFLTFTGLMMSLPHTVHRCPTSRPRLFADAPVSLATRLLSPYNAS